MGEVLNNMADGIVLNTKDCPVDEALGTDDPNNVFTCKKAEECCTVDLLPACCAEQDIGIAIEQQLKLWIPLLGMIFMLSVFIWFCRTDEACCDVEKPCLYRFGCKKYPPNQDAQGDQNDSDLQGSQLSLQSGMTTVDNTE